MRKLIMQQWISLDGFMAGPDGDLDFFTNLSGDANKYADLDQLKFLNERLDTFILGRNTYKLFVDFWPTSQSKQEVISDRLNEMDKFVFSNTLKEAPWGEWPAARVMSGDAVENIRRIKSQPGKDIALWGSLSLCKLFMEKDLIDEYHFQICPVILGDGIRMFDTVQQQKKLTLMKTWRYESGVTVVQYAVTS